MNSIKICINETKKNINKRGFTMKINNKGFSFPELMIAMAIFVVITAIASPSFLQYRNNAMLGGAIRLLRGDLELAKMAAIRTNETVRVMFNVDGSGYQIVSSNGSIIENRVPNLPSGVSITPELIGNDTFTSFNGRGCVPSTKNGEIQLCHSNGTILKKLSVNRLGSIRIL